MNGAEAMVRTLVWANVDTCFANPGTSEIHFVAALDRVPGIRCVLGLFEGVVTGAADGYGRMTDKPAALARGMGVEAAKAETMTRFNDLFQSANRRSGPFVIELTV